MAVFDKENINELKIRREFALITLEDTRQRFDSFGRTMRSFLEQSLKDFGLDKKLSVDAVPSFFMDKVWKPGFCIHYIEPKSHGEPIFLNINGNWIEYKGSVYGIPPQIHIKTVDLNQKLTHVEPQEVIDFKQYLMNSTGLPCKLDTYVLNKDDGSPILKTTQELLNRHNGAKLICEGLTPKPWAILRTKKGTYIFYFTTNDIGLGYDQFADATKKINFFGWYDNDNMLASIIPEKHRANIMEK